MTSGPETIQIGAPPPLSTGGPAPASAVAGDDLRARTERTIWRLIPLAILAAAWIPALIQALPTLGPQAMLDPAMAPGGLKGFILRWMGEPGLYLVAAGLSGAMALGTWLLARALGAPRWAAATVASVAIALHVVGLAPSPVQQPADAGFAAAMVLAAAMTAQAVATGRQGPLALAFVLAVVACWFRPWAAWPAAAVLVGVVLVTRLFEERPWCGFVAATAWGPGIWLAKAFSDSGGLKSDLFRHPDSSSDVVRQGVFQGVEAARTLPGTLADVLVVIAQALPFAILGLLALAGVALCLVLGGQRRLAALAAGLFTGLCVFGAAGYGDLTAARLLLDPLLLGLAAGAAVALPALARRSGTGTVHPVVEPMPQASAAASSS